jgi:hypothetical protein
MGEAIRSGYHTLVHTIEKYKNIPDIPKNSSMYGAES